MNFIVFFHQHIVHRLEPVPIPLVIRKVITTRPLLLISPVHLKNPTRPSNLGTANWLLFICRSPITARNGIVAPIPVTDFLQIQAVKAPFDGSHLVYRGGGGTGLLVELLVEVVLVLVSDAGFFDHILF